MDFSLFLLILCVSLLNVRKKSIFCFSLYFLLGGESPVILIPLVSLFPFTQSIPRELEWLNYLVNLRINQIMLSQNPLFFPPIRSVFVWNILLFLHFYILSLSYESLILFVNTFLTRSFLITLLCHFQLQLYLLATCELPIKYTYS